MPRESGPGKEIENLSLKHIFPRASFCLLLVAALSGCIFHRGGGQLDTIDPGDQPDKILYEKAVNEITRGRFEVGRLTLQALINTYPDSEFLSKAKLAIADSYYNEGGVSGLTQAEAEYKDFITFFPTAPEAPEAQYKAGLAHYRLMGKPDRDRTEAKIAEAEFKEFLLKYPDSTFMPRVKARLRQVQEVLGQSNFKIAKFYFAKHANRAAESRFQEITDYYPNFSRGDEALWLLGQTLERLKRPQQAVPFYARIITEHPLSPLADDAKGRLTAFKQPIPQPTRAMLARAEADAMRRDNRDIFQKLGSFLSSSPNTSATRHGPVRLGEPPPSEVQVATKPAGGTGGTSLVVQPVGEESLKAGKPVPASPAPQAKPAGNGEAQPPSSGDKPAPEAAKPAPQDQQSTNGEAAPQKKKGKLGFLKKIVKPF
jgi:outer membrane protein assembly factor BamD